MATAMMKCSKCGQYFIGVKLNPESNDICYNCEPVMTQFVRARKEVDRLLSKMEKLQKQMGGEEKA